jgi:hypothetical protein
MINRFEWMKQISQLNSKNCSFQQIIFLVRSLNQLIFSLWVSWLLISWLLLVHILFAQVAQNGPCTDCKRCRFDQPGWFPNYRDLMKRPMDRKAPIYSIVNTCSLLIGALAYGKPYSPFVISICGLFFLSV